MEKKMSFLIGLSLVILGITLPSINVQGEEFGLIWSYQVEETFNCVAVSGDGSYIVAGSDKKVYFFDRQKTLLWAKEVSLPIRDIAVTEDGKKIAAGGYQFDIVAEGFAYGFSLTGEIDWSFETTGVSSVSYSPEGNYFAMTRVHGLGWQDVVSLWSDIEERWLWEYGIGEFVGSAGNGAAAVSRDGRYVAVSGPSMFDWNTKIWVFDTSGETVWSATLEKEPGDNSFVAISADGNYVAAGNEDFNNLYFFRNTEEDNPLLWTYETGTIKAVSLSADGSYVIAGTSNICF